MDKVVSIRYGVWSTDPYYQNNPENVQRTTYYGIGTSTPQALVDGGNLMLGSTAIANNVGNYVNYRLPISSPYEIKVKGDIGAASVHVTVILTATPPANNKVLRVAVIEKSYDWPSAPGSNGQTHFEGCLLDMVPNPNGTPITVSTIGDSQTFSFNYNISQVNYHPSFNLTIIAFVQNEVTKEILQTGCFDGKVGLSGQKTAALIESNGTANLSGFIFNDFSNTSNIWFRIKGEIPAGWNITASSSQGSIPINGPIQNLAVNGYDSLFFDIAADPQGNGGAVLLTAKLMLPADTSVYEEVKFSAITKNVDVLVVDGDGGASYESYIINALNQTSYSYGVIPVQSGDLTASDLDGIPAVIWNSGLTEPALSPDDINALGFYLDFGGRLYLNGVDIAYQLADPTSPYYTPNTLAFFNNYLHSNYIKRNYYTLSVDGINNDPISNGIYQMKLFGGTGANNLGASSGKYPNEIAPRDTNAASTFKFWYSANSIAGIRAIHYDGKVVFTTFGFESIAEDTNRTKVAGKIVDWLLSPVVSVGDPENTQLIKSLELGQNYPNPFNPETQIKYALPVSENSQIATLVIYDQLGQKVKTLVDEIKPSGRYEVTWNGKNDSGEVAASGIYFYQLKYGKHISVKKMALLR